MKPFFRRFGLAGALFLAATGQVQAAATILLWPIDPWLAADAKATELWIQNQGNSATTMQVRIVRWKQENGHERYTAQQDVVASPPIVTIAAGSKQLIRLIKQASVPAGVEQAYRIIVDEIPQADVKAEPAIGLKLQMRYSIPLFVYGLGIPTIKEGAHHAVVETRNLSWRVTQAGGQPALEVQNRGDVHVRLSQVALEQGGQKRTIAEGLLGYVLPGSSRSWPIPAGVRQPERMSAQINARDAQWQSTPVN
ncbi:MULTISPECIES: fimbrial biogenesis chaperone [Enterobacter]|uniref:Molecular chaperone n=1 Tax=Enterobacter sichuanensis TaxID=2071710 RepID=A0ABS6GF48_9ENTR|nr:MULTISPECIES: molecular chaperone [Enterobacter]PAN88512.1 sigma-fimbriae chaperone protein [Enterobacter cloacae]KLW92583.1 type 1 pili usher pathway chaperone CsuC [Enterobacter sp. BIDMC92]MBU5924321.1 molecular chaperone [Enterobacter sichuanensis]MCI8906084.1 molecular chaperone [Enterobacter sp.]PAO06208.1 sigma-fimbriae chaperone protein [Enterobacter cloacae]